jgi:energy-coupling factor transport system ATP-binding protein
MTDLAHMLRMDGMDVRADVLTVDEMVEEVCRLSSKN